MKAHKPAMELKHAQALAAMNGRLVALNQLVRDMVLTPVIRLIHVVALRWSAQAGVSSRSFLNKIIGVPKEYFQD
jgi:hypothetical protein